MIASEIIPNLWIGDIRSSEDISFLSSHKISVIVNCTTKYPFSYNKAKNIRIPVRDRGIREDIDCMYKYLILFIPELYKLLSRGERVLIHCYAGRNRSVAIIIAFLIKYGEYNVDNAFKALELKWKRIDFNFFDSLNMYYNYLLNP